MRNYEAQKQPHHDLFAGHFAKSFLRYFDVVGEDVHASALVDPAVQAVPMDFENIFRTTNTSATTRSTCCRRSRSSRTHEDHFITMADPMTVRNISVRVLAAFLKAERRNAHRRPDDAGQAGIL